MPLRQILCFLLAISLLATGCLPVVRQQAFPVSPFNGYANDYHPQPQVRDSSHTAVYVQGAFLTGGANEKGTDYVNAFRTSLTIAHHSQWIQAYYGADLSLGSYHMGNWDSGITGFPIIQRTSPPINATILNEHSGGKFFGGLGFHGGINGVMPTRGGEWRFLGLETSLHQEFGDYLDTRKKLPDSAATLLVRNPFFATLGATSELIGYTRQGEFGFRLAVGGVLGNTYSNPNIYDSLARRYLHYGYYSLSIHYTFGRYGSYVQFTHATKATSLDVGVHVRLSRPKIPSKK